MGLKIRIDGLIQRKQEPGKTLLLFFNIKFLPAE